MLSRAKHGMYILGNQETLSAKKRAQPTMICQVQRLILVTSLHVHYHLPGHLTVYLTNDELHGVQLLLSD